MHMKLHAPLSLATETHHPGGLEPAELSKVDPESKLRGKERIRLSSAVANFPSATNLQSSAVKIFHIYGGRKIF